MKLESFAELKIYDSISQPIMLIDDKNRIIYCNTHAGNFLSVMVDGNYINEDINDILKFKEKNSESYSWFDFYRMNEENFEASVDINLYRISDVKISLTDLIIKDKRYKFIVISKIIKKESFFNNLKPKDEVEVTSTSNIFNFINIKDYMKKYSGEVISDNIALGIVNATSTGIVIEKNNKIISINNSAKSILGEFEDNISEDELLGKSLLEIVDIHTITYKDKIIEKQHECLSDKNIVDRMIIRKDGSKIFCEITTMFLNEKQDKYYIYLIKDITKRVEMEKTLISNKNGYMKLLELLPIGVMLHTNNKFNSANKAQEKILGVEEINNLTSEDIINMIHEDSRQIYREMYYYAIKTGKTTDVNELKMIKKDGSTIEVEMVMMTMTYEGERCIIMLTEEITERKRAQIDKLKLKETLKYDKLKTEFISNVSHELKTPLNIILSTVQLLQFNYKDNGDEQLNKYLELTKVNSYRLLRLINNLIDGTSIDVGNLKMNFENYNIVKIVEDITMEAVEYVENKGLTITFDTNVEEKIIGVDKDNIERIILNLLSNAVKFSKPNGRIEVQVIDEGDIVKLKVSDDGKGISKEDQEKIFYKFVQVEQLFTRSHEGTGIGLSLVKSIVENHGGNIYVKSELGVGSEFTVELPNILSKKSMLFKNYTINQVSSTEKVKIEFSDI